MGNSSGGEDRTLGFLAMIEQAFIKMITGLFRFIGVYIPQYLYQFGKGFFDGLLKFFAFTGRFLFRLFRVGLVATVWLAIVFGPLGIYMYYNGGFTEPSSTNTVFTGIGVAPRSKNIGDELTVAKVLVIGWAVLCLMGSAWALRRWIMQNRKPVIDNSVVGAEIAVPISNDPPMIRRSFQIVAVMFLIIVALLSWIAKR
jgi:hypothetical protein